MIQTLALTFLLLGQATPLETQRVSIEGRVLRSGTNEPLEGVQVTFGLEGVPLVNVLVKVIPDAYNAGGVRIMAPLDVQASTDDRGEFRLLDVGPGRYHVVAQFGCRRQVCPARDCSRGLHSARMAKTGRVLLQSGFHPTVRRTWKGDSHF